MRNITPKFFLSGLTSLLVLSSAAIADPASAPKTEMKNVQINSRPLPPEIKTQMEQKRIAENSDANNEQGSKNCGCPCGCKKNAENKANVAQENNAPIPLPPAPKPKTELNVICTFSAHWITGFSLTGDVIEMEDGSQWAVAANQIYKVQSWRVGDNISITPNYNPFSNYIYYIVNNTTGSYVAVTPFVGPLAFGPNTNWVVGLDFVFGQVTLVNGNGDASVWSISNSDYYLFSTWAINDTIIVGDNDSWLYMLSPNDHILINVNMNHYVRSRQL